MAVAASAQVKAAVKPEDQQPSVETKRLLSLDVFRGITVAAMILVNNPGSTPVYTPLEHAEWDGWTPTDLVFPFFLFIVGISITFAFSRRIEQGGSQRDLILKIIKRTLIIFGIGLLMAAFPFFHLTTLRIPGVLQRIAVCYFFASIIALKTNDKTQIGIVAFLLLGYWAAMKLIPVPGFGASDLGKEGNLGAYLDRLILTQDHMWRQSKVFDPEGIFSTFPAIATTLLGVLTGKWLKTGLSSPIDKVKKMLLGGAIGVVVGLSWGRIFPINKALWTSSYVVFCAGAALLLLAVCYWVIEIKGYKKWAVPFVIFGVNAITVYFVSGMVVKLVSLWKFPRGDGRTQTLLSYTYNHLFASWLSQINASLAYAIFFDLVMLFLMWLLYRKKIFIKI